MRQKVYIRVKLLRRQKSSSEYVYPKKQHTSNVFKCYCKHEWQPLRAKIRGLFPYTSISVSQNSKLETSNQITMKFAKKNMKMTESFFSSNWLRFFFKESDLCQKRHFWKCKSSFTAHNGAPKTRKWKIALFILKTVIFLELVKGLGASSPHLELDLLFENRLRRKK